MRIRSIKPEFWRSDDIARLSLSARLTYIGLWSYVDDNGVGADQEAGITADLYAFDLAAAPEETLRRVRLDIATLVAHGLVVRFSDEKNRKLLYIASWDKHQRVDRASKGHQYPRPTPEMLTRPEFYVPSPAVTSSDSDTLATHSRDPRECLASDSRDPREFAGKNSPSRARAGARNQEQGARNKEQGRGSGEGGSGGEVAKIETPVKAVSPTTAARGVRGQRLPEGWMPKPEVVEAMRSEFPAITNDLLRSEHRKFRDYWIAQAGAKGVKLDWDATWRNWIRRAMENHKGSQTDTLAPADAKAARWQALKEQFDDTAE